jgi:hypothetical protein
LWQSEKFGIQKGIAFACKDRAASGAWKSMAVTQKVNFFLEKSSVLLYAHQY